MAIPNMKGLFTVVENAVVIISKNGVYKQVSLYKRGETLFANVNGGFVTLKDKGATSCPSVRWDEILPTDNEKVIYKIGSMGYLTTEA